MLSIVTMCIASIIVINLISDNKDNVLLKVISVIPLGISPYFLQCLSYKYDCFYMAISILVSVFPLIFYKEKTLIYSLTVMISTIFMCITYQASSGIFLVMVLILGLKMWNNNERIIVILKFLFISVISYIIGLLIFKLFIYKSGMGWVDTSFFSIYNLIPGIIQNIKKYYESIGNDFTILWKLCILIISICFIITSTIKSKRKKYMAVLVSLIVLLLAFILCFGVYIALKSFYIYPRGMYGFCTCIAIISVYAIDLDKNYICKIACIILTYSFFSFSLTYGNALAEQKRYTDFRIQTLINDMNNCGSFNGEETKKVVIKGNIGNSPVINSINKKYKILNKLVPSNLGEVWFWDQYYFFKYFKLKNIVRSGAELDKDAMKLISDTMYQSIYCKEEFVLIVLK